MTAVIPTALGFFRGVKDSMGFFKGFPKSHLELQQDQAEGRNAVEKTIGSNVENIFKDAAKGHLNKHHKGTRLRQGPTKATAEKHNNKLTITPYNVLIQGH